jgi:hypothetical protein
MDAFPIIDKLGGREAVLEALQRGGSNIRSIHAIRMWSARGSIPGDAVAILMAEAERLGIKYSSVDFSAPDPEDQETEGVAHG